MKPVEIFKSVLMLLRPLNLVIICISLYLARYFIVIPILEYNEQTSSLTNQVYMLIVLSTVLIAAGGYVINDYFDTDIDLINKPGKNAVGNAITRFNALLLYTLLTLGGVTAAVYFSILSTVKYAAAVYIISALLLYMYSAFLKKKMLSGNLVVSFLSGLTILLSILFDPAALNDEPVKTLIIAYALFAFFMTLVREILKDCEDLQGDVAHGATTLPVIIGMPATRWMAIILLIVVAGAIIYIQVTQRQWENVFSFLYVVTAIQLPMVYLIYRVARSRTTYDFRNGSMLTKLIMITGLISIPVFYLTS